MSVMLWFGVWSRSCWRRYLQNIQQRLDGKDTIKYTPFLCVARFVLNWGGWNGMGCMYYKESDQNVKQTFAWISLVCSSHDIAVDWWWWKGTALKAVFNQKADSEMVFSTLPWNMCANQFFRSQKHIWNMCANKVLQPQKHIWNIWNMCANMLFESEKNILVTENIKGLGFVSHFWKYVVSFETTL